METGIDGVRTLRRRGADGWLLVVVAHLLLLLLWLRGLSLVPRGDRGTRSGALFEALGFG